MDIAKQILEKIKKNKSIIFFGHKDPDGDCVGSTRGLKHLLQKLFPEKEFYVLGTRPKNLPSFLEEGDHVEDELIKESLGILVDLSGLDRAEDQRVRLCKDLAIIDHHIPGPESTGILAYRMIDAPSATFVAFMFFRELGVALDKETATCFYMGLVTDTERFFHDVTPEAFDVAKELLVYGVDAQALYQELYKPSPSLLRFRAFVYTNYKTTTKAVYLVVNQKDYMPLGLSQNDISNEVSLLSGLESKPYQAFFVEKEDGNFRVELRSDGFHDVEHIARTFGGGGHFAASGCLLKSKDDIQSVLDFIEGISQ